MNPPRIVADRLYGITLRPQELALYGERVAFDLRYAPIVDDGQGPVAQHFKLLVLEITARLDPGDELARQGGERLLVAKCGWELELACDPPCTVAELPEAPGEVARLLGRIADTINDLARRAGVPEPLGPDVVSRLVLQFRTTAQAG